MNIELLYLSVADFDQLHAAGPWEYGWHLGADTPILVAKVGGAIVGYLDSLRGAVTCMEVRPEWRDKGIGRALVEHHRARYKRVKACGVDGLDAECFWAALGFKPADSMGVDWIWRRP